MQAKRVLETCLYAEDLDAAEDFYSRVLGLKLLSRVKDRHVFFYCGSGVFLLFNPARTSQPGAGVPLHGARGPGHVAFEMDGAQIELWRDHLGREGIAIEAEVTWPAGGYSIYFRDPSGNSVELATAQTWGLSSSQ